VVWGYARGAAARGVHIHAETEVTGIDVENGRVTGVRTSRGTVATGLVLNATVGWWQADPAAGYVLVFYATRECRQIFRAEH